MVDCLPINFPLYVFVALNQWRSEWRFVHFFVFFYIIIIMLMILWKLPKYWACSLTFSFLYLFMITMRGNLRNHDTSYFILLICFSNKSLIISKSLGLMCKLIRRRGTSDTWMRKHRPKRLSSEQIISQGVLWRRPIVGEMRRELPPLATWLVPFHFPHCQLACPGVKNSPTWPQDRHRLRLPTQFEDLITASSTSWPFIFSLSRQR